MSHSAPHTASGPGARFEILSHRGLWRTPAEKNTAEAFVRSFSQGFGTETDVRDAGGALVISHDPARADALPLPAFFEIYNRYGAGLPLALNVKADGLAPLLRDHIVAHGIRNYFCFDMSVPDARGYLRCGLASFSRQSEEEREPAFYDRVAGVWMDAFDADWVAEGDVARHLAARKRVCIVSPELHRRPHLPFWDALRSFRLDARRGDLLLCTDWPVEAKECFDA
jgi:glycerophosphoryl diester phosphodiesterase